MAKQPRAWIVDFDSDAVIDFEDVKSRGDRKAVFNVVQKLKDLGPDLPSPHMKSLRGEAISSSCGRSRGLVRFGRSSPARRSIRRLAVAAKKKDFDRTVVAAGDRLKRRS